MSRHCGRWYLDVSATVWLLCWVLEALQGHSQVASSHQCAVSTFPIYSALSAHFLSMPEGFSLMLTLT
jgi:hypothetical protein